MDLAHSLPQMVRQGDVKYIVLDFLTEVTLSWMAAERIAHPELGFAQHFAGPELERELPEIVRKGIVIVANAGGLNPPACAAAVQAMVGRLGLSLRIATVTGDDVRLIEKGARRDMFSGAPIPENRLAEIAYLGAAPIARALAEGAQMVITGRCVDSALAVGPMIHEFGWRLDDYPVLGAATAIGHILECGAMPTGGCHTDWCDVDWSDSSFPIAECFEDGTAIISKAEGTGGVVTPGSISEQIVYEIGDPRQYRMPDVICDMSGLRFEQIGRDKVRMYGATGRAPSGQYKVCCLSQDGWTASLSGVIGGPRAAEKARRTAESLFARLRRWADDRGLAPLTSTQFELIGGSASGEIGDPGDLGEVVFRVVIDHPDRDLAALMTRAGMAAASSMAPGTGIPLGIQLAPRIKLNSYLLEKEAVRPLVEIEGQIWSVNIPLGDNLDELQPDSALRELEAREIADPQIVPLGVLALTRSGDKGNLANLGVVARDPSFLPYLAAALSERAVAEWFAHLYEGRRDGRVTRHFLPGIGAINLLLHDALSGGAVGSQRLDTMGKALGQQLVSFPVKVPASLARSLDPAHRERFTVARRPPSTSRVAGL
jgi:hypothetical protein